MLGHGAGYFDLYVMVIPELRLHSLCILQGGQRILGGGSQILRAKKGGI